MSGWLQFTTSPHLKQQFTPKKCHNLIELNFKAYGDQTQSDSKTDWISHLLKFLFRQNQHMLCSRLTTKIRDFLMLSHIYGAFTLTQRKQLL